MDPQIQTSANLPTSQPTNTVPVQVPNAPVQTNCKYCSSVISTDDYFCPNCGKKLKNKPASLKPLSLIWLLILSTLLPPLGFGVTIRYIKDNNQNARTIGWISLLVTIIALVVMVITSISIMQNLSNQINSQLGGMTF